MTVSQQMENKYKPRTGRGMDWTNFEYTNEFVVAGCRR